MDLKEMEPLIKSTEDEEERDVQTMKDQTIARITKNYGGGFYSNIRNDYIDQTNKCKDHKCIQKIIDSLDRELHRCANVSSLGKCYC